MAATRACSGRTVSTSMPSRGHGSPWFRPSRSPRASGSEETLRRLGQALSRIAKPLHDRDDLFAVRRIASQQRQLDAGVAERQVGRLALVLHLDDVDLL